MEYLTTPHLLYYRHCTNRTKDRGALESKSLKRAETFSRDLGLGVGRGGRVGEMTQGRGSGNSQWGGVLGKSPSLHRVKTSQSVTDRVSSPSHSLTICYLLCNIRLRINHLSITFFFFFRFYL